MRLIDADALDVLKVIGGRMNGKVEFAKEVNETIQNAPTVDAVPVIRCKDCKWYYRGGATCMYWDGENNMHGDDYCSRAERKEE